MRWPAWWPDSLRYTQVRLALPSSDTCQTPACKYQNLSCYFCYPYCYTQTTQFAACVTSLQALIIMSKPRDHPDPGIPAVFVSEKAGIIMRKLITPGQTRVRIVPVS
jgi:hypothetical protein